MSRDIRESRSAKGRVTPRAQEILYRLFLFVALLALCPVPITDFFVSAGIVPIGWFVLVILMLPTQAPGLIFYWMAIPYTLVFYFVAYRLLARLRRSSYMARALAVLGVVLVLGVASLFSIYRPMSHASLTQRFNVIDIYTAVLANDA
jgi:hypothetical protein